MNQDKAQIIALVTYGNFYFRHKTLEGFYPDNPVFNDCSHIAFFIPSVGEMTTENGNIVTLPVALGPEDWFQKLIGAGITALKLNFELRPDGGERATANMIPGGVKWVIEAISPAGSDYWEARWSLDEESKFVVSYVMIAQNVEPCGHKIVPPDELRVSLAESLKAMRAFLFTAQLPDYQLFMSLHNFLVDCRNRLDAAVKLLEGDITTSDYIRYFLYPLNLLPLEMEILLDAAHLADIFGLPEWPDLVFQKINSYENIAQDLYEILTIATENAANASALPHGIFP